MVIEIYGYKTGALDFFLPLDLLLLVRTIHLVAGNFRLSVRLDWRKISCSSENALFIYPAKRVT